MAEKTLSMDIISTNILPRLPSKSLCRFKCVSKSFLTLISSSHFINLHSIYYLSSQEEQENNRTLFISGKNSTLYSLNLNSLQSTPVQFPLSGFFSSFKNSIEIVGSCNGLLCIASGFYSTIKSIILLNPSTRSFREIPFHHLPGKIGSLGLGFGFNDACQDYKIVSVVECIKGGCVKYVVVYSLNENTWKFLKHNISSREYLESNSCSVLVNNNLVHWLFFGDYDCRIGCFDLRAQEWTVDVPLPERDAVWGYFGVFPVCLRVLDWRLCFGDLRKQEIIDVWIMKEYGVKESWLLTRILVVNIVRSIGTVEPLASRKDEILLKPRNASNVIFVYNISNQSITRVGINGVARFFLGYECYESLAAVPGSPQIEAPQTLGLEDAMSNLTVELPPYLF